MDEIIKITGKITGFHVEQINLTEPFIDFSARFASMQGTVVLLSGGSFDCSRYHILGAKPWLTFTGNNQQITVTAGNQVINLKADPFDMLRKILKTYKLDNIGLPKPIAAGLFGYLSYDLKDCLENLPRTSINDLNLPHICLFAPSIIIIRDKKDKSTRLCIPKRIVCGKCNLKEDLNFFKTILTSKFSEKNNFKGSIGKLKSNFIRSDYLDKIKQIKKYIAAGHVYQVNMAQRFEMEFNGDTFSLFRSLFKKNPAPFFSYINAGNHQIVSTSPERFILRTGNQVETRPIKGTRPRGKTAAEDNSMRLELKQSKKDDAELSMIVDLLRNDIGKVCMAGSVRVAQHKRLERYQNVYHLVSVVEGTLKNDHDSVDLIAATFPGGSITGCPKIRAMEIIDELEPNRRHIYTGSIGYIGFNDTMDLSIAIRTATICNNKIYFSVGGGIIFDSDPLDEYDETMHKGKTLIEIFKEKEIKSKAEPYIWINGTIKSLDEAFIPVDDQGFLFGYGFFETIRVDKGKPMYLKEHIARFYSSWKQLFSTDTPDLTWDDIIEQVITKNDLKNGIAAVKIIATKGNSKKPPINQNLLVTARPYTHRLAEKKEPGINLATYPEPRETPLADHKTLNYLFYLLAGNWAKTKRADEALIMNPDGTISETNSANIMLVKGNTIIIPFSHHVLPGIMEKVVCRFLAKRGYKIERKKLRSKDLFSVDDIIITNSLIGAMPILSIDNKKAPKPSDLWQVINKEVI